MSCIISILYEILQNWRLKVKYVLYSSVLTFFFFFFSTNSACIRENVQFYCFPWGWFMRLSDFLKEKTRNVFWSISLIYIFNNKSLIAQTDPRSEDGTTARNLIGVWGVEIIDHMSHGAHHKPSCIRWSCRCHRRVILGTFSTLYFIRAILKNESPCEDSKPLRALTSCCEWVEDRAQTAGA